MTPLSQSIATDRARLGMSQQELARLVGVSQQSVAKWEAGLATPRGKRLRQLTVALGKKSLTADTIAAILHAPGNTGTHLMAQQMQPVSQAQALAALAQAAQEIAAAAKALADSVAVIAKTAPPPGKH